MSESHKKDQVVDLKSIDQQIAALQIQKQLDLKKGLNSEDPLEIIKAQSYLDNKVKTTKTDPKAYFFPMDYSYQTGKPYKEINNSVPDHILRKVSYIHIVDLIIQTKINQVSEFLNFTTDEQKIGFTVRKKLSRFENRGQKETSKEEQKEIERIVDFVEHCGYNEKWDIQDDLFSFTGKILRDSFTFNRLAFEQERNMLGDLIKPVPVDAMTIRLLETIDPYYEQKHPNSIFSKKKFKDSKKDYLPRYCQIWDNMICVKPGTNEQIVWYPWELAYETRRKSTDIWRNGYPIGEIEVLTNIITWIINGLTYNGNFFSQGSNPKGILNVKEEGGGQQILNQLRQMWTQSIAGVGNSHKMPVVEGVDLEFIDMHHCLSGNSEVITSKYGNKTLNSLLEDKQEVFTEIWDGVDFTKAKVFKTGKKQLCKTVLSNKLEIETSPDHKFCVLRGNKPTWIKRIDLKIGDYVLVNKKQIESKQKLLTYKGKTVGSDLFELIGWITGDGNIGDDKNSKRMIKTFYHPNKEQNILFNHLSICKKYNINANRYVKTRTDKEILKLKEKYGIKSVIKENPYIAIVDVDFFNWLIELGFTTSKLGKTIPSFLYSYDSVSKNGFLRGFFSADGSISKNGSRIDITISNSTLKHQTKMLLMTEGIRCSSYISKKIKSRFNTYSEDNVLLIKDRDVFFNKIGFLQEKKQKRELNRKKTIYKINEAPIEFIQDLALQVKNYNKTIDVESRFSKKELHDLLNISKGHQKASLSKVISYANVIGFKYPSFIDNYNLETVSELIKTDQYIDMVDVEMFSDNHSFIANGIVVHNSNKDMEFQMWNEFLIVLTCAVFQIDPSELGFHFKTQSDSFGSKGEQQRLDHSKDKGLKPILVFLTKLYNKYIVSELNDEYEFVFTGVDIEDETSYIDNDKKKLDMGAVSMEDMFEKYSNRKFDPEKDTILNQVYQQTKQQEAFGGVGMNDMVDEQTGEPDEGVQNSFDEFSKSQESNPIWDSTKDWLQQNGFING